QNPQNPNTANPGAIPGMPPQPGTNPQPGGTQQGTVVPPGVPGVPGVPNIPGMPGGVPGQVTNPNPAQPGQAQPSNQGGFVYNSGMGQTQQQPTGYPTPGQNPTPFQPGLYQGAPVNSQTGGVSPQPYQTTPGANGMPPNYPQPGGAINPQQMGNQAQ